MIFLINRLLLWIIRYFVHTHVLIRIVNMIFLKQKILLWFVFSSKVLKHNRNYVVLVSQNWIIMNVVIRNEYAEFWSTQNCFKSVSFSNVFHVAFVHLVIRMMPMLNWRLVLEMIDHHRVELLVVKNKTCQFDKNWDAFVYYFWVDKYKINKRRWIKNEVQRKI